VNSDLPIGEGDAKLVTKIEQQKKNSDRQSLFLDGVFAFGVSAETFSHFQIHTGQSLTEKQILLIQQHDLYEQAKESAVKYLALRMRGQKELEQYLSRRKKFPHAVVIRVIQYCLERHYLDDQTFCETFIRDQLHLSKNGAFKIRQALIVKGIERDLIAGTMARMIKDDEQLKTALALAKKKAIALKNDPKRREKLYRFLAQKGYSAGVISQALKKNL